MPDERFNVVKAADDNGEDERSRDEGDSESSGEDEEDGSEDDEEDDDSDVESADDDDDSMRSSVDDGRIAQQQQQQQQQQQLAKEEEEQQQFGREKKSSPPAFIVGRATATATLGNGSAQAGSSATAPESATHQPTEPPAHQGWVEKQGHSLFGMSYRKRLFVLADRGQTWEIAYYQGEESEANKKGSIPMGGSKVTTIDGTNFVIDTPNKSFPCRVDTPAECTTWIKKIGEAIRRSSSHHGLGSLSALPTAPTVRPHATSDPRTDDIRAQAHRRRSSSNDASAGATTTSGASDTMFHRLLSLSRSQCKSDTKALMAPEEPDRTSVHSRGVSLAFLRQLRRDLTALGRTNADSGTLLNGAHTTSSKTDWMEFTRARDPYCLKSCCLHTGLSFVETCMLAGIVSHRSLGRENVDDLRGFDVDAPFFGDTTSFVSYTWRGKGITLLGMVTAIEETVARETEKFPCPHEMFFFIDIFVCAQHRMTRPGSGTCPNGTDVGMFEPIVQHCRQLLLFCTPLKRPLALSRVWCLFEIMKAMENHVEITVLLGRGDVKTLKNLLLHDFDRLSNLFTTIDAENAQATMPADKDLIFGLIEQSVGFKGLNHIVGGEMRKWLATRALQLVEETGVTFQETEERLRQSSLRVSVKGSIVVTQRDSAIDEDSESDSDTSSDDDADAIVDCDACYAHIKANGYECLNCGVDLCFDCYSAIHQKRTKDIGVLHDLLRCNHDLSHDVVKVDDKGDGERSRDDRDSENSSEDDNDEDDDSEARSVDDDDDTMRLSGDVKILRALKEKLNDHTIPTIVSEAGSKTLIQNLSPGIQKMVLGRGGSTALLSKSTLLSNVKIAKRIAEGVELMSETADMLSNLDRYEDAKRLHMQALGVMQEIHGDSSMQVATARQNIADDCRCLDDDAGAEAESRRALEIIEMLPEDPNGSLAEETADALDHLATTLVARGGRDRLVEAEGLLARAIDIDEECDSRGPDDIDTAGHLNTYADCFRDQGKEEEALELQRRAFAIERDYYLPTDVEFGTSCANLAFTLMDVGKTEEALSLHRRRCEIHEAGYGLTHSETAHGYAMLANALDGQSQTEEEVEGLRRKALMIYKAVYGENDSVYAITLSDLASSLKGRGKLNESEQLGEEAMRIIKNSKGVEDEVTADLMLNLAETKSLLHKDEEAEELYRESIRITETVMSPDDIALNERLCKFAYFLHGQGKLDEACTLSRRAIAIVKNAHEANSTLYQRKMHADNSPVSCLAEALEMQGFSAEARKLFEQSLTACKTMQKDDAKRRVDIADKLREIGQIMKYDGPSIGEALKYVHEALTMMESYHGDSSLHISKYIRATADVEVEAGNLKRAERLYRRDIAMEDARTEGAHLSPSSAKLAKVLEILGRYDDAASLLRSTLDKLREGGGATMALYKAVLETQLASVLFRQDTGAPGKVIELQRAGLSVLQKHYGRKVPMVMAETMRLADFLGAHSGKEEAAKLKKEVDEILSDRPAINPKFACLLRWARGVQRS